MLAHPREIQPVAVLEPKQLLALLTIAERAEGLRAAAELALKQITDLDDVLNQPNHEITGWHLNGCTEPAANFFRDNDHGAVKAIRAALAAFGEKPNAE